jgi:hypothetical protein
MNLEKKDYFEMQVRKQVEVRKKQNHWFNTMLDMQQSKRNRASNRI